MRRLWDWVLMVATQKSYGLVRSSQGILAAWTPLIDLKLDSSMERRIRTSRRSIRLHMYVPILNLVEKYSIPYIRTLNSVLIDDD